MLKKIKKASEKGPFSPKEEKEKFLKKFPTMKKPNAAALMRKKFYDEGGSLPVCVNHGCEFAVTVREWKYVSIKSECTRCARCRKKGESIPGVIIHKKKFCENKDGHLGFECPVKKNVKWDKWQESLDLDHKDGDHLNNDPKNVETICNLCHTRKSKEEKDWNSNKASGRKIDG